MKFSLFLLALIVLAVIVGPWLSPHDYQTHDYSSVLLPPSFTDYRFFGTDDLGRDLFVRAMEGGRISLLVGVVSTLVSLVLGVLYGATAGYIGGRTDHFMMRLVDILYAIPFMFFVILLMVLFGRNIFLIFVAIGAVNWLDMARIVRGQTMTLRQREFVEAAEMVGASRFRIITRHIVPNLLGVVIVYATLTVPQVILIESFLSFIGLGVQAPMTSWGDLVEYGTPFMSTAPWTLIIPSVLLAVTLLCMNFVGDGLRDALDPRDGHR
ncbi:MAG: ABC transporter permease subunit [Pseudomonadota bacterium]